MGIWITDKCFIINVSFDRFCHLSASEKVANNVQADEFVSRHPPASAEFGIQFQARAGDIGHPLTNQITPRKIATATKIAAKLLSNSRRRCVKKRHHNSNSNNNNEPNINNRLIGCAVCTLAAVGYCLDAIDVVHSLDRETIQLLVESEI